MHLPDTAQDPILNNYVLNCAWSDHLYWPYMHSSYLLSLVVSLARTYGAETGPHPQLDIYMSYVTCKFPMIYVELQVERKLVFINNLIFI